MVSARASQRLASSTGLVMGVILTAGAGVAAVLGIGVSTVGTFIVEEAVEEIIEKATGIPIMLNPADLIKQGLKKEGKK